MSTNNSKPSALSKRQPRMAQDYKAFCRYVWQKRQKGKRRHAKNDK